MWRMETGVLKDDASDARHTHGKIHLTELNLQLKLGNIEGNLNRTRCAGDLDMLEKELRVEGNIV